MIKMLQRLEERRKNQDHIHNFETQYCPRRWEAPSAHPVLDIALSKRDSRFVQTIQWPGGASFAACLTHDVDEVQRHSHRHLWRICLQHLKETPVFSKKLQMLTCLFGLRHRPSIRDLMSPWLEAEKAHGFRSTWFISPSRIRRRHLRDITYLWGDPMPFEGRLQTVRETFREIASRGWEIGMHGSIFSAFDAMTLAEQREDLCEAMGREITAGRQHNLQFEMSSTPDHLAAAGFQVDSTLGSNRDIFFRTGSSYPTPLWSIQKNEWLSVFEVPLILHDGALMRQDNLDLTPEAALEISKKIIDRVAEVRGVVTLLWHPDTLVKPGYFDTYVSLLDYIQEKNGWGAGATEIVQWWKSSGNAERHASAVGSREESQ